MCPYLRFSFARVEGETKKFEFCRASDTTFLLVHFEFQRSFKIIDAVSHYSLGGSCAFDIYVAVVGISYKFVSSAFQQFVKFCKVDVGEER